MASLRNVSSAFAALAALYNATRGHQWTYSYGWLEGEPCASYWYGVDCDDNGTVTELNLDDNGLHGTIPSALGSLSELATLRDIRIVFGQQRLLAMQNGRVSVGLVGAQLSLSIAYVDGEALGQGGERIVAKPWIRKQ